MANKPKISIKRYLGGLGRGGWFEDLDRVQCDYNYKI
jgi:hypothetical protein